MIEQLGNYAHVREDETDPENYILVRAKMGISHGLYRWIMKYGGSYGSACSRKRCGRKWQSGCMRHISNMKNKATPHQKTDSIAAVRLIVA